MVLRALGLGDLLAGVPALRALAAAHPDHERVLLTPAPQAPLLDLAGTGFRVADTRGLEQELPIEAAPDLAVNLHGRGPQSHRRVLRSRPRRLVAFGHPEVPHDGPAWRDDEHEVARWCRLVEEGLGVPADSRRLALRRPGGALVDDAVVVHPGAAHVARRWPVDRFAAVAGRLRAEGHRVVLTGGQGEAALAEEVRRMAGLDTTDVLAGRTDVLELAALVASARLVVCGDTGMAHLASAFGTPSVVLFGPTPPARWGPPVDGRHRHHVLWHGEGVGDPWADRVDPALAAVSVQEVLASAHDLLRDPGVTPR